VKADLKFRKLWLAIGWALVLLVIFLSLIPAPPSIPLEQGDKLGHVVAYATVMLWFSQLYAGLPRRLLLATASVALGIALEFVQRETGYRSYEVADMVADSIGVALGWVIAPPRTANVLLRLEKFMSND
jgi:VanZ family protein